MPWEVPRTRRLARPLLAVFVVVAAAMGALLGGGVTAPEETPADRLTIDTAPARRVTAPDIRDGAIPGPALGAWQPMATGPLDPRTQVASAWTGEELLIWGGRGYDGLGALGFFDDGAAYDPERDRWRRLPASALAGRVPAAAVWTGSELLVWGGTGGVHRDGRVLTFDDGAAYDPARDRWQPLAPSPLAARRDAAATWDGGEMVIWGGFDPKTGIQHVDGARYDPAADAWRTLPPAPLRPDGDISPPKAVTACGRSFVMDAAASGIQVAAHDPVADAWTAIPQPLVGGQLEVTPVGGRAGPLLVGASYGELPQTVTLQYDCREGSWSGLPPPPGLWRPDTPVARNDHGLVTTVDPASRNAVIVLPDAGGPWRRFADIPLGARSGHVLAAAGRRVLVWGGVVTARTMDDGAVWSP